MSMNLGLSAVRLDHGRTNLQTLNFDSTPSKLIPAGFSLTRASTGTYFDSAGLLQTAAIDAARGTYRYNGSAWVFDGTIVEAAATNTLPYSNLLSSWTAVGVPVVTQNQTGIDGTTSAWTVTDNSAVLTQYLQLIANATAAGTYVYPVWVGKTSGAQASYPVIAVEQNGASRISLATIDTSNGIATAWTAYTGFTINTTVARINADKSTATDWCVELVTTTTGVATIIAYLIPAGTTNATQSTGTFDVTTQGSARFQRGQLELGSNSTSYIDTPGAASITRAADVLTAPTSGLLVNGQGFAAIKFRAIGNETIGAFLSSYQGAATDAIPLEIFSGFLNIYDGTAFRAGNAMTLVAGSTFNIAGTWGGVNCQTALNGVASASLTFDGSMGFTSTLRIGDQVAGAVQPASMVLQSLRLGTRSVTGSELAAWTA